jgi:hypothetical protein
MFLQENGSGSPVLTLTESNDKPVNEIKTKRIRIRRKFLTTCMIV